MVHRLFLAALLLFTTACAPTHDAAAGKASLVAHDASQDLKRTHVSAILAAPHLPNASLIWCATMQLAWDQFPSVLGGPLTLAGDPAIAVQLNASPFPEDALDDGSFIAVAGKTPGAIDTVKAELARKFKGAASPSQLPASNDGSIIAYAYLFKNLQFETPLTRLKGGLRFTTPQSVTTPVAAFGISKGDTRDWEACAAQVVIWRDEADDDFVIELKTREPDDRLLIARMPPRATLQETAATILAAAGAPMPKQALQKDEPVSIPVLNFDITRNYEEVLGLAVTTPGAGALELSYARQNIRFRLDEKGAVLKSEGGWGVKSAVSKDQPRRFICDGPFAIIMARKGAAVPYFAAWIDNPEILVPHK